MDLWSYQYPQGSTYMVVACLVFFPKTLHMNPRELCDFHEILTYICRAQDSDIADDLWKICPVSHPISFPEQSFISAFSFLPLFTLRQNFVALPPLSPISLSHPDNITRDSFAPLYPPILHEESKWPNFKKRNTYCFFHDIVAFLKLCIICMKCWESALRSFVVICRT